MNKVKIAALGDSITKGVVMNEENMYSVAESSFVEILRKECGVDIENYGRFGCTVNYGHQVVARNGESIAHSDYTIVEYGGNDCDFYWKRIAQNPTDDHQPKTTLATFRESLVELLAKIRALGSRPLILSLPPIDSASYFSFFSREMAQEQRDNILRWMGGDVEAIARWHEDYNQVLFEVAHDTGTPILNITEPFVANPTGLKSLICPDGIHPNSEGHRLIARSIMTAAAF